MRAVICSGVTLTVLILARGTEYALAYTNAECNSAYNEWMDRCDRKGAPGSQARESCVASAGTYLIDCTNSASDKKGGPKNAPVATGTSTPGGIHRPPARVPQHGEHY
jgi:hypothetical protein